MRRSSVVVRRRGSPTTVGSAGSVTGSAATDATALLELLHLHVLVVLSAPALLEGDVAVCQMIEKQKVTQKSREQWRTERLPFKN